MVTSSRWLKIKLNTCWFSPFLWFPSRNRKISRFCFVAWFLHSVSVNFKKFTLEEKKFSQGLIVTYTTGLCDDKCLNRLFLQPFFIFNTLSKSACFFLYVLMHCAIQLNTLRKTHLLGIYSISIFNRSFMSPTWGIQAFFS